MPRKLKTPKALPPTPTEMPLGRLKAPDTRDLQYPMSAVLQPKKTRTRPNKKLWTTTWVGSQGQVPACVGYGWHGFLRCAPLCTSKPLPLVIYAGAQENDEFKGPPPAYEGSSVRGGAKYLSKAGRVGVYHWARGLNDVLDWLAFEGPVVLGTDWHDGMFTPDKAGFVDPSGKVAGGHCYLAIGYDFARNAVRCVNSWGRSWGQKGRFWIAFEDLGDLLTNDGEACATTEIPPTKG